MSNERVDTTRPEYSWIPFFEELAKRLHEDGWRERLFDIVREMVARGLPVPQSIANLRTGPIDPFTFMSMLSYTDITPDNFNKLSQGIKDLLGIQSPIPDAYFLRPQIYPGNLCYFNPSKEDRDEDIATHWEFFEFLVRQLTGTQWNGDDSIEHFMARSLAVYGVGISKLTAAMYWIDPNRYMHTKTIDTIVDREMGGKVDTDAAVSTQSYFQLMAIARGIDSRPIPVVNDEEYQATWKYEPARDFRRVWMVRSDNGVNAQQVVDNGYIGLGWDDAELRGCRDRSEIKDALSSAYPDHTVGRIRGSAGSILRYVHEMGVGDVVITPDDRGAFYRGTVKSDATFDNDDDLPYRTRRQVRWDPESYRRSDLPRSVWFKQQTVVELRDAERDGVLVSGHRVEEERSVPVDGQPNVWLVRSGVGGINADTVVSSGYIGIGWEDMDIRGCRNKEELDAEWDRAYHNRDQRKRPQEVGSISRFVFGIAVGDYVVTTNNRGGFYVGEIRSGPTFDNDDGLPFPTRREVQWFSGGPHPKNILPAPVLLGVQAVLELRGDKRNAVLKFINLRKPEPGPEPYTIDTMLEEGVFADRRDLARMLDLLRRKKSLILQGPPGTGKTFIARKLAYALQGDREDWRISSVQFHQSYSYEDFVGGLRPDTDASDQLIFTPQDGAFLRVCSRARGYEDDLGEDVEPEVKYVMLIDEINRGNLSRVFGELLMLIEADKRNPDDAIELQHLKARGEGADDGRFYVPPNVYIIGTMNLADRSLTGMNVAMRRRFGFVELEPQFDTDRFRDWIANETGMPDHLRDRIIDRMESLNAKIGGDPELGKQYAVGHSFFVPDREAEMSAVEWERWYQMIVDYEIGPLLEEYWFDKLDVAADEVAKLRDR